MSSTPDERTLMAKQRQFSPEAQARREAKAQRAANFREAALDAMDVGRGWSQARAASSPFDGGEELAVKQATAAVEMGRPLRANEARRIKREVLAEQSGRQPASAQQRRRPSPREWLERMRPEQRRTVERNDYFKHQTTDVQAAILRLRDEVDEIDAEAAERAEYELARQREEAWLAESWDNEGGDYWEGADDAFEERLAGRLQLDSDSANADWEDEFGEADEEEVDDE